MKYGDRSNLVGVDHSVWERFLGYFLGEKVWGYRSGSNVALRWSGLLSYECQIRKEAGLRNATGLHVALGTAWGDPTLHQEFFTLQLCTSGAQVTTMGSRTGTEDTANKRKNSNDDVQNST